MANGKKKRGRPTLAAQSLDEAVARHLAGLSPKRPRNEFEREVMRGQPGRKKNLASPTQVAAELAAYFVQTNDLSLSQAARQAADVYGVNADNVRGYARDIIKGPQVTLHCRGGLGGSAATPWVGMIAQLVPPQTVALVADADEVDEAFTQAGLNSDV